MQKIHKRLNIPLTTVRAIIKKLSNIWNSCKLARKRTRQVHVVPTHSEEDGEGGKEEPKDHSSRTADISCVLGSQSLKINHKTPPHLEKALCKNSMKKVLTREQPTNSSVWSLPNVIGSMTGTGCYGQMRPKWNFLAMYTVGMFAVKRGMHTRKSTSYLPSNMVVDHWCFGAVLTASGPGALVKINGIMNSTKYQDILAKNLFASVRRLRLPNRQWTHTSKARLPNRQWPHTSKARLTNRQWPHTSKATRKWFCGNKINVLQWPSQSPDLNRIENMWSELKRAVHKRKSKDLERFWMEEWSKIKTKIPPNVFSNLIKHYRNRLSAVILAKVQKTKVPVIVKLLFIYFF